MVRGVTPVVGVVVLTALTVALAGLVLVVVDQPAPATPVRADFSVSANASVDRIELTHTGGDTVQSTTINVTIYIEGEALDSQPPIPFFAADGFRSGPTGPFNSASTDSFRAGVSGSVRLAETNQPLLSPGDDVTVVVSTNSTTLFRTTVTAT